MKLTIASFNILCVRADNGNSIPERAPRIDAVLKPLDADLIGFQEATPTWLSLLEGSYGGNYELYNVYRSQESPESTPIAWKRDRFECLEKGNLWFSDTPEVESLGWDELYRCPRIVTWARLKEKATGQEFCFANTHFGFGDGCQAKSVGILRELAHRMGCPCVITGDFNLEMDSPAYALLTESFTDVNARTVNDLGPTFHGFDPEQFGEHIDYCFITPEVRPLTFRVLRDKVEGKFPSDHYLLAASVEL